MLAIRESFLLQHWPEGDEEYHSDLLVPVLLIYGSNDKFVTVEEERWTEAVSIE